MDANKVIASITSLSLCFALTPAIAFADSNGQYLQSSALTIMDSSSDELSYVNEMSEDYVVWKIYGSNLSVRNNKVQSNGITKVAVFTYDNNNNLLEEEYTKSFDNIEVTVDQNGLRPTRIVGKNLIWEKKTYNKAGYETTTKVSNNDNNLDVTLNSNGDCVVSGESYKYDCSYTLSGNLSSLDYNIVVGDYTYATSYRGSSMQMNYSGDEVVATGYTNKIQKIYTSNKLKEMFVDKIVNGNNLNITAEGDNLIFDEGNSTLSGIKKLKTTNKNNTVRTFETTSAMDVKSLFSSTFELNNVKWVNAFDSSNREIHVYGNNSYNMNLKVASDGSAFETMTTSGVSVGTINHILSIETQKSAYNFRNEQIKPPVIVKLDGELIEDGYSVSYKDNTEVGEATITVDYYVGEDISLTKSIKFNIVEADNKTFNLTPKNPRFVYGNADSLASSSLAIATGNIGKVSYKKLCSTNGNIDIFNDGRIMLSNNLDCGTYVIVYEATDSGDSENVSKSIVNSSIITVVKAENTIKTKAKSAPKYKFEDESRTIAISKLLTTSGANGKFTYKKISSGSSKYLTINSSNGNVTLKKNAPKGTHKIVVDVTAAGDNNHKSKTSRVTLSVKVV